MNRVLVTGASGMLGFRLTKSLISTGKYTVFSTSRRALPGFVNHLVFDLAEESYESLLGWANPEIIIHCAAMTNVDQCEENENLAIRMNVEPVIKFASYLKDHNPSCKFIFISSDAVKPEGIHLADESVKSAPVNVYGKTKMMAERALLESGINGLIVRTTIVGLKRELGQIGFVDSIIDRLQKGTKISLFDDAVFTPISCVRLADILIRIMKSDLPPILNISGSEPVTKFHFGDSLSKMMGLDGSLIEKGSLKAANLRARRILDQSLSSDLLKRSTEIEPPTVNETISELIGEFYGRI